MNNLQTGFFNKFGNGLVFGSLAGFSSNFVGNIAFSHTPFRLGKQILIASVLPGATFGFYAVFKEKDTTRSILWNFPKAVFARSCALALYYPVFHAPIDLKMFFKEGLCTIPGIALGIAIYSSKMPLNFRKNPTPKETDNPSLNAFQLTKSVVYGAFSGSIGTLMNYPITRALYPKNSFTFRSMLPHSIRFGMTLFFYDLILSIRK